MTINQFAQRHFTNLRYLSQVWGIRYESLKRYSVAQRHGGGMGIKPSARIPSEAIRKKIHELTQGKVHWQEDWPVEEGSA